MSSTNEATTSMIVVFAASSLAWSIHHVYKFDRCRCLVPKRKEWFRVLLTWMLLLCQIAMLVWGAGWAYVKYNLGWVKFKDMPALPYPEPLFPAKYRSFNAPLTAMLNISYSLQVSLNAEEGLYWYHLMRAVRQPKSMSSWLGSGFFYAWIVISVVCAAVQCNVGWIGYKDSTTQLARSLTCGGCIELVVLLSASFVLLKFPKFLQDVKASGAGPEVRSRLHFYHEMNKVRALFRLFFVIAVLALGIDGLTPAMTLNLTPLASDLLIQVCLGSFFIVIMISMVLYLPRNVGSSAGRSAHIMVGQLPEATAPGRNAIDNPAHQVSGGFALMSLLREGGQWDGDDDIRSGMAAIPDLPLSPRSRVNFNLERTKTLSYAEGKGSPREQRWDRGEDGVVRGVENPQTPRRVNQVLNNFVSPISPPSVTELPRPLHVQIHVERQVHRDDA